MALNFDTGCSLGDYRRDWNRFVFFDFVDQTPPYFLTSLPKSQWALILCLGKYGRMIDQNTQSRTLANLWPRKTELRSIHAADHAEDLDGPMFRSLSHNRDGQEGHRACAGYATHSVRATFITTALENGATLDDVRRAAGHRERSMTRLYDRRGYNPEKSASFFATYWAGLARVAAHHRAELSIFARMKRLSKLQNK
jgi:hypothetical protein